MTSRSINLRTSPKQRRDMATEQRGNALAALGEMNDSEARDALARMPKGQQEDVLRSAAALTASDNRARLANPMFAAGFSAATRRAVAIITHDDFGGRADAAAKLLGNEKLASLSADEIAEMIASTPDDGTAAMLAALKAGKNPNLGTDGGDDDDAPSSVNNHGWGRATARVNDKFGHRAAVER